MTATYIDLSQHDVVSEREINHFCALALFRQAASIEMSALELVGRKRVAAMAEARSARAQALEYWARSASLDGEELLAESIQAYGGVPSGHKDGDLMTVVNKDGEVQSVRIADLVDLEATADFDPTEIATLDLIDDSIFTADTVLNGRALRR